MTIKKVRLTAWVCRDGHRHLTKESAERCEISRPTRLRRAAERAERLKSYLSNQKNLEDANRELLALQKALEDACLKSEIGCSALEFRVALALFARGATGLEQFKSMFVTKENTLALDKLGRVGSLTIDDYPSILSWVNGQITKIS